MSELTKEDLKKLASDVRGHGWLSRTDMYDEDTPLVDTLDGDCLADAFEELLTLRTLRDAGDEEVEKWHKKIKDAIQIDYFDSDWDNAPTVLIDKLRDIVITRGQQIREAQAEIERLKEGSYLGSLGQSLARSDEQIKSLQSQIATLTAERDGLNEALSLAGKDVDRLASELAALKSAPGMEEVDAILQDTEKSSEQIESDLAALARRSIAAQEEVVGLLKEAAGYSDGRLESRAESGDPVAIRILEIVEGK